MKKRVPMFSIEVAGITIAGFAEENESTRRTFVAGPNDQAHVPVTATRAIGLQTASRRLTRKRSNG